VFEASPGRSTLLDFHYKRAYRAARGKHGSSAKKKGRDGADIVLMVPVGTLVKDHETGDVLADLDEPGKRVVAAAGGRGGRGNARFASPTNRAPTTAEPGRQGHERSVDLELKLIADAGLVGLPNSGKSTLLSKISDAKPKIGDFPFTTLSPVLGLVRHGHERSFVVADLPGLIEGAHLGRGLGHRFLRHIERTRVLVMLLDITDDPARAYRTLIGELTSYGAGLDDKPRVIALNKSDLAPPQSTREPEFGGERVLRVSGLTGSGLEELKQAIVDELERADL
jgi:GTP-binding protein